MLFFHQRNGNEGSQTDRELIQNTTTLLQPITTEKIVYHPHPCQQSLSRDLRHPPSPDYSETLFPSQVVSDKAGWGAWISTPLHSNDTPLLILTRAVSRRLLRESGLSLQHGSNEPPSTKVKEDCVKSSPEAPCSSQPGVINGGLLGKLKPYHFQK